MWSTQFGFPYMPFLAFSSPAFWWRVFQSCSFDRAVFSGLAFSVPPFKLGGNFHREVRIT